MTELTKPVSRRTQRSYRVLYNEPREIVVTLLPGDYLAFRESGRREKFILPIDQVFRSAVKISVSGEQAARKTKGNKRRG